MSTISLNTASTGLNALSTNLDVIANNLANVNTTGFRGSRANFEDLFYLDQAQPGIQDDYGTPNPTGLQVGLGVQLSGTSLNVSQGSLEPTADAFDLAIMGDGWILLAPVEAEGGFTGLLLAEHRVAGAVVEGAYMGGTVTVRLPHFEDFVLAKEGVELDQVGLLPEPDDQPAAVPVGLSG